MWLVRGDHISCLVQELEGALQCNTTAEVARHGIVLGVFTQRDRSSHPQSRFVVLGLAPDWAKRVRLLVARRIRIVRIRNNAYAFHAELPIKLMRLER
jgi:hypothetical protein